MDEGRVLFDASAYMLFEATGDSESAAFHFHHESDAAEDDAQSSCTYGSFCDITSERLHEVVKGGDGVIRGAEFDYRSDDDDDDEEEEEEDGVVDQCRRRSWAEPTKCEEANMNMNMMNEREGDKLFWEACLAS